MLSRAAVGSASQASGGQYVGSINYIESQVSFTDVRVASDGGYALTITYASGSSDVATQRVWINDAPVPDVSYPPTGGWDRFMKVTVQVPLRAGLNSVRLGEVQEAVNLDMIEISAP